MTRADRHAEVKPSAGDSSSNVGRRPRRNGLPWKTLTPTILIPNLLHGLGQGAAAPAIPIAALQAEGSYANAAIVAAMLPLGQLASTLPAGWFVGRFNEKRGMIVAAGVTGVGALGAFLAPTLTTLMLCVFLMGTGVAVFTMGRHAWITAAVPVEIRARTLSLVSGFNRLGMLGGPFLAAAAFASTGAATSAFVVVAVASLLLLAVVAVARFIPEGERAGHTEPVADRDDTAPRVFRTMWTSRRVLARLGLVASIVGTMRSTRRILVPLAGVALGMDLVTIALIVGFASTLDFSLVYVGGLIMDSRGRMWVAVPALLGFGVTNLVIGIADVLPASSVWFVTAVMLMAVGNGISGGLVATMGSDLADPRNPAAFLSSWRLVAELGPAVAPFAIAAIIATASVGVACAAIGALAIYGAAVLPRYARRYLPDPVSSQNAERWDEVDV